jgi:Mn2+/Fe2+ NRAMP family transporter
VKRIGSILFWSIISAAFIGPGTVTTAASAGAAFGFTLLWALVFSTVACLTLQEAAARITVCSGHDLGRALRLQYPRGAPRIVVRIVVLGAVVLGCAAYQTGNILGGVAGAALGTGWSTRWLTLSVGAIAFTLLWFARTELVARILGVLVALMGVVFVYTAWQLGAGVSDLLRGALLPRFPPTAGLLVLGLIGTTVVPYNLFLGSGLARGRELAEVRFGLSVAVILGGLVSAAIVVVGSAVDGAFSFASLAEVLERRLGRNADRLFAVGLCAAGISSAVTAPLAAAITVRGLLADPAAGAAGRVASRWSDRGSRFRGVWIAVLFVGLAFALADLRPIPVILLAQALNGILLPSVAIFLLFTVNDRRLMGEHGMNGVTANTILGFVVAVTVALGLANLGKALSNALGLQPPTPGRLVFWSVAIAAAGLWPVWRRVRRLRRAPSDPHLT